MASTIFAPSNDSKNGNGNGKQYCGNNPQIKSFSFCYRPRVDILTIISRVFVLLWEWLYRGYSICINNNDPHSIFLINLFCSILCAPSTPENYKFLTTSADRQGSYRYFFIGIILILSKIEAKPITSINYCSYYIIAISSQYTTNQFIHSANKTVAII